MRNMTDDEVEKMAGESDKLVCRVHERYGIASEEAENRVNPWATTL